MGIVGMGVVGMGWEPGAPAQRKLYIALLSLKKTYRTLINRTVSVLGLKRVPHSMASTRLGTSSIPRSVRFTCGVDSRCGNGRPRQSRARTKKAL